MCLRGPAARPGPALRAHIHEGGEEEHRCYICHENWRGRGRVICEDGVFPGEATDGIVTHVKVVGNRATVFTQLPEGS